MAAIVEKVPRGWNSYQNERLKTSYLSGDSLKELSKMFNCAQAEVVDQLAVLGVELCCKDGGCGHRGAAQSASVTQLVSAAATEPLPKTPDISLKMIYDELIRIKADVKYLRERIETKTMMDD